MHKSYLAGWASIGEQTRDGYRIVIDRASLSLVRLPEY